MSEGGQGDRSIDDKGPKLNVDSVREQIEGVLSEADDKLGIELEGAIDIERQGSDLIERISREEFKVGIPRSEPRGWYVGFLKKNEDIRTASFVYYTGNEPPKSLLLM